MNVICKRKPPASQPLRLPEANDDHGSTTVGIAACTIGVALTPACRAFAADATPPGAHEERITVIGHKGGPVQRKNESLDRARDEVLLPKFGATTYDLDHKAIETLPQGADTPIDKVLLQAPGVSADTAISNPDFHIRNEYANVQYRCRFALENALN